MLQIARSQVSECGVSGRAWRKYAPPCTQLLHNSYTRARVREFICGECHACLRCNAACALRYPDGSEFRPLARPSADEAHTHTYTHTYTIRQAYHRDDKLCALASALCAVFVSNVRMCQRCAATHTHTRAVVYKRNDIILSARACVGVRIGFARPRRQRIMWCICESCVLSISVIVLHTRSLITCYVSRPSSLSTGRLLMLQRCYCTAHSHACYFCAHPMSSDIARKWLRPLTT